MDSTSGREQAILSQLCRIFDENQGDDALRRALALRNVSSASLDQLLRLSTPASRSAVRELQACSSKFDPRLFRALMNSPSGYELPWEVACVAVQRSCSSNDASQSDVLSLLSDVKGFLRQVVSTWWEEERKLLCNSPGKPPLQEQGLSSNSSRNWLLRLLSAMINPIFAEDSLGDGRALLNETETWRLPTDVVSLIVTLSHELDASLLDSCLNLVFAKRVRPEYLLPWLQLASNLATLLRDQDWNFVHGSAAEAISIWSDDSDSLPSGFQQSIPEVVQAIFALSCSATKCRSVAVQGAVPWQALIRRLLSAAAQHTFELYSRTEQAILSCLTALSPTSLHVWASCLVENGAAEDAIPAWIDCNLLLLLYRSSRQGGATMVSQLVAKAFGRGPEGDKTAVVEVPALCRVSLHHLLIPPPSDSSVHRSDSLLDGISYAGAGAFHSSRGHRIEALSAPGQIIFRSLFPSLDKVSPSRERGRAWLEVMFDCLKHNDGSAEISSLFTIAASIVFLNLPTLRREFVDTMLESLSCESEECFEGVENRILVASICVISAGRDIVRDAPELDGLSLVFAGRRLSFHLTAELLECLHVLPSVKQLFLNKSRKLIGLSPHFSIRTSEGQVEHLQNEVKMSLYALTLITLKLEWSDKENQAWCMLYDALVGDKPIPLDARTWLYGRIQLHVERKDISSKIAKHYLRALAVRLLKFFGPSERGDDVFLPGALFYSETATSTAFYTRRVKQNDDLSALFRTIFLLIPVCADSADSRSFISNWIRTLRDLVQGTVTDNPPRGNTDGGRRCIDESEQIPGSEASLAAPFYCMHLYIRKLLDPRDPPLCLQCPSTCELGLRIRQDETAALEDYDNLPTGLLHGSMPGLIQVAEWSSPSHERQFDDLRNSLCDLVIEILAGRKWTTLLHFSRTRPRDEATRLAVGICRICLPKRATAIEDRLQPEAPATLFMSLPSFTSLALPAIETILSSDGDWESLDLILSFLTYILTFADSNTESGPPFHEKCRRNLTETIWSVYTQVSDERAAVRIIKYMDRILLQGEIPLLSVTAASIYTEADTDAFVRCLRFRVMRALLWCLQSAFGNDISSCAPLLPKETAVLCLESLSSDLLLGIKGNSGGLCNDLFDLYLSCIESCVLHLKALVTTSEKMSTPFLHDLTTRSFQAINSLDLIVCTVSLKSSSTLKKALHLCSYAIPSLAASAATHTVRATEPLCSDSNHFQCGTLTRTLVQCTKVLDRIIEFKLTRTFATWETVSGFDDSRDTDGTPLDEISNDDDSAENRAVGSAIVRESRPYFHANILMKAESRRLPLHSERAWCWTVCELLKSAELHVDDSLAALQDDESSFLLNSIVATFLKYRCRQNEGMNDTILSLFDVSDKEQASAEAASLSLPAEARRMISLPIKAKVRLLSFAERCLLAIQRSLLVACKFLRQPYQSRVSFSLAFIESVSHLHGWLISPDDEPMQDPCACLLTWYAIEKTLSAQSTKKSDVVFDGCMVPKLERAAQRVGQIEVVLDRFRQEIQSLDEASDEVNAKTLRGRRMLLELNKTLRRCTESQRSTDLKAVVSRKLKGLSELRRSLLVDETGDTKKRLWTQEDRSMLGRQRNIRSRNQVVDEWLQLDRSIGHDETLEVDAYADLEDFLE